MKNHHFFRFAGNRHTSQDKPFNGLLHFIPQPVDRSPTDTPRYAAFESTDLQWLEIKENISTEGVRVELLTDTPRYWLLFQLGGTVDVYLPHAIRVTEGTCFSFGSRRSKVPLVLASGHVWLLVVACKPATLPLLAAEFEPLADLAALGSDEGPLDVMIPEVPIDYAQHRRFDALEKMAYKPFGTPVFLSDWLHRTLLHLYNGERASGQTQITLYHDALQYIKKHYRDDISKASIAEALHVSTRKLNRAFENRPIKISDFILKLKLNKAKELFYGTDAGVEEVSRELNFSCPKHFSKLYKQYFFESPTEFKQKSRRDRPEPAKNPI